MIDLMKRLAELDSKNPNMSNSRKVDECGMMPEMGAMERPSTPASLNVTAGSGEELGNVLKDIMSLAGVKPAGAEEPLSAEPALAIDVEPEQDMDPNSSMRSVMDLMNPEDDEEGGEEVDGIAGLDQDHDGDHDMGDHDLETDDEEDDEEADEGQYDNSPANPIKPPMFEPNRFAHQENQPGQGDRMDGDRPKAYADMNEATKALFADYKKFVSEAQGDYRQNYKPEPEKKKGFGSKIASVAKKVGKAITGPDDDELLDKLRVGKKVSEAKPSAGMSAKEKSSVAKKASAGKDIGKPGKNFDKVASKAGGGEKGKKIAAAAMWKNAAKK